MVKILDRVWQQTATTGTGTLTLGSALPGFLTAAEAGGVDTDEVEFVIRDGDDFELSRGVLGSSSTTLTRATVIRSKIGGTVGTSKINLSGAAEVFVVASAAWAALNVSAASAFGTDNRLLRSDGTGRGVQGSGITVDDSDRMTGHGNMAWQAATQGAGGITFDCDSGKLLNWYITASAARQVQVPSNLPDGWTAYLEIDPSGNAITWAAGFRSPVPDVSSKAIIAIVRRGSEYVAGIFHEV